MLTRYDPNRPPDPERWLRADDGEKAELVRRFHRRAGIRPPNEQIHALLHVVVENQVAMGDAIPSAAVLQRLMGEGVDRHEALHAMATVLARYLFDVLRDDAPDVDPGHEAYFRELEAYTIQRWRDEAAEDEKEERPPLFEP